MCRAYIWDKCISSADQFPQNKNRLTAKETIVFAFLLSCTLKYFGREKTGILTPVTCRAPRADQILSLGARLILIPEGILHT